MIFKPKKSEKRAAEEQSEQANARAAEQELLRVNDRSHFELSKREDIYRSVREILALRR